MSEREESETITLQSIDGVTWVDDDGARYRRVVDDGEVVDVPVRGGL